MERENNQVGRLVLMLSHTILKNRNRHMAAIGLTAGQADCLRFCLEREEGTVTDLKEYLGVTHQTAQGLVRRLGEKGLLSAVRSQRDGRCQVLSLTPEGRAAAERMLRSRERTGDLLLRGMSPREQEEVIRLLTAAYENVRRDGAEDPAQEKSGKSERDQGDKG